MTKLKLQQLNGYHRNWRMGNDRESQEVEFIKEPVEFTKEFVKASRQIYKLISMNPKVSTGNLPVIC